MAEVIEKIATYKVAAQVGNYLGMKKDATDAELMAVTGLGEGHLLIGLSEPGMADGELRQPCRLLPANAIVKATMVTSASVGDLLYCAASGKFSTAAVGLPVLRAMQAASGSGSVIKTKPLSPQEVAAAVVATATIGQSFVLPVDVADGATGDVTAIASMPFKVHVIDYQFQVSTTNSSNANTNQLCAAAAGASTISDALSTNGLSTGALVRAAVIDQTNKIIAKGAALYIRRTRAGGANGGRGFVTLMPVA